MAIKLGDIVPNFQAEASPEGSTIDFHEQIGNGWAVLFSHPDDFTPVCTSELGTAAKYQGEFAQRGVKMFALSCNDVASHRKWVADIEATRWAQGTKVAFPIIADPKREVAVLYGMLDPEEKDSVGLPMTCRAAFVIHNKALKLQILYPATTGRNFDEILRVIDSLQLTASHSVATPVNWTAGSKCMVVPSMSDEAAKEKFGGFETVHVPSAEEHKKEYIRMVPDPSGRRSLKECVLHQAKVMARYTLALILISVSGGKAVERQRHIFG